MTPKVALSKDFLKALSSLPPGQQKKVREFTEKFQRDPTQPGINFERLEGAADPKVRSVRVDKAYRAIVVHPPKGDVYLLVWVDHHDEAYRWVRGKRFDVNPASGTLQLYETVEGVEAAAPVETTETYAPPGLFDRLDDEDLLMAGVPQILLPPVRALTNEAQLDELSRYLPEEAAEMLVALAAGYGLVEAMEEVARKTDEVVVAERLDSSVLAHQESPRVVDTEDFAAALMLPDSQRTFKLVEDERTLEEMLDAPLDQWRVFLHPSQREVVQMDAAGPVRLLGGAGTGKTVALMHRAKHLVENVFTGKDDRVLVTTFTRNLAMDLKEMLKSLCGDSFRRIEVSNIHGWAASFLRRQGVTFDIVKDPQQSRMFERAAEEFGSGEFPVPFLRDEWDYVVQAQGIRSREEYLTARRVGRGTRIGKRQRLAIWEVFQSYREQLQEEGKQEWPDVVHEARMFVEKQSTALPYRSVLADEVQDLSVAELRLLRALVPRGPNDLFLAGDAHQRIYGHRAGLRECGIDIGKRTRTLRLNYRTTEEIHRHAVGLLAGLEVDDLDEGVDAAEMYRSIRQGPAPELHHCVSEADEASFVIETLTKWLETVPPRAICVAARTTTAIRERYAEILESVGIDAAQVGKEPESTLPRNAVRLATMHRMKGLEFRNVLLVGIQKGIVPLRFQREWKRDGAEAQAQERLERCLFYVACTRARDELAITGYGEPSPFLEPATTPG